MKSSFRCAQIKDFVFGDEDGFTGTFNEWAAQNTSKIDLELAITENKLEYTQMYEEVRCSLRDS